MARVQHTSATVEPGERSMPPVRITSVAPMATIATIETWSETLLRLAAIKNRWAGQADDHDNHQKGQNRSGDCGAKKLFDHTHYLLLT